MAVRNTGDVDFQPHPTDDPNGSRIAFTLFCGRRKSDAGSFGWTANPFDHITTTPHTVTVEGTLACWLGGDVAKIKVKLLSPNR